MCNISKTLILPRYIIRDQATGDNVCYISDTIWAEQRLFHPVWYIWDPAWKGRYVRIIATSITSDQHFLFLKGFSKVNDWWLKYCLMAMNDCDIQGMLRDCEVSYFFFVLCLYFCRSFIINNVLFCIITSWMQNLWFCSVNRIWNIIDKHHSDQFFQTWLL